MTNKNSQYLKGQIVRILPQFRDVPVESHYVVVGEDEGKGRVDISPVEWKHGRITPVEVIRVEMIELV